MSGPAPKVRYCRDCTGEFFFSDKVKTSTSSIYCLNCVEKHPIWANIPFEDLRMDRNRKKRLIKEFGHRCWKCGNTEWMKAPIPLQLDHIDGNSDNNSRENLQLLCPNCHAQTETFGGKNKGNAVHTERAKYRSKYRMRA
jgi:5-methylcytosine-specific restriction endonuclease McrA